ncbi:MAG: hypothetical protein KDK10_16025 [Maritimibacter sp.]|nr:hypothetical protein [Maritimibacter sp.]
MLRPFLALLAFLFAVPAAAQELRLVESWPAGAWLTASMQNLTYDRRFCAAETTSANDQVFRVVLYEDDDAFIEVLDPAWEYPGGEPLEFILVIDRDEWKVTGQGWPGAMTYDLIDPTDRDRLLAALSTGRKLDIRKLNRSRVAQFSLDGAGQAISSALACWDAERAGGDYKP